MNRRFVWILLAVFLSLCLPLVASSMAQTSTTAPSVLTRRVHFGGVARDLSRIPLTGVVGLTLARWGEQISGSALWVETQNVTADGNSHYTAFLRSRKPDGLPAEVFTSEQSRCLSVQVSGQPEQTRVLFVSAPYALKAGYSETLGGFPDSAFVLAASPQGSAALMPIARIATAHSSAEVGSAAASHANACSTTASELNDHVK